jgi:hypothetical protein
MVSKPTVVSTNWLLRSPFKVTGTPTTYSIDGSVHQQGSVITKTRQKGTRKGGDIYLKTSMYLRCTLCLSKSLSKLSSISVGSDTFIR